MVRSAACSWSDPGGGEIAGFTRRLALAPRPPSITIQPPSPRVRFVASRVAFGLLVVLALFQVSVLVISGRVAQIWLIDYELYMDATRRWLSGGFFYPPAQLAGSFDFQWGVILYPPPMLLLFAPFTLLPWWAWVGIPAAVVVWIVLSSRPSLLGWALILACIAAFPTELLNFTSGTPTIWFVAAVALATRWPAASVLVLLKPTLAPFALLGIRSRGWWAGAVGLGLVSLAMWPLTLEWLQTVTNMRGAGLLYSLPNVPLLLIPLLAAWSGRR